MGSIHELRLSIKPGADEERARAIVDKLSDQRRVEDLGGTWWRTEYPDFGDRKAAADALYADLRAIDKHWGEALQAGYMPEDTPEPPGPRDDPRIS